jgi:hypothetical protein
MRRWSWDGLCNRERAGTHLRRVARELLRELVGKTDIVGLELLGGVGLGVGEDCEGGKHVNPPPTGMPRVREKKRARMVEKASPVDE